MQMHPGLPHTLCKINLLGDSLRFMAVRVQVHSLQIIAQSRLLDSSIARAPPHSFVGVAVETATIVPVNNCGVQLRVGWVYDHQRRC